METELEIQALLGVSREPLAPMRPEDAPDALIAPQTEDQPGAYSGPYEAGGVWAVVEGAGVLRVNERVAARSPSRAASACSTTAATRTASWSWRPTTACSCTPPASRRAWPELVVAAVAEQP